ncbi:MAG: hypothetical protein EXS10_07180 [Phycisphaerales bacterium]|nr:hypothetical protein [Phycisphaerales bacterium]
MLIGLYARPDGTVEMTCSPAVHARLKHRMDSVQSLIASLRSKILEQRFPAADWAMARFPTAHGLAAFSAGYINAERAGALLSELLSTDAQFAERISSNQISLLQSRALLPTAETRGAIIVLDPSAEDYAPDFLDAALARIAALTGEDWQAFVSIVRTVTFVAVEGRPRIPYFSGSTTDFWGSIHMVEPLSDEALAESITHEAAHLWLNLVEEVSPLCSDPWGAAEWASPWRDDPRPLAGIIHGVFVFSCASVVLASLVRSGAHSASLARLVRIATQVEAGAEECGRSESLTEVGRAIVRNSLARLANALIGVNENTLNSARQAVRTEQLRKIERLTCKPERAPHG